jgi:BirA family biotin operon repressor/biotin-[acetyl-CoA-carboxylase] ligase
LPHPSGNLYRQQRPPIGHPFIELEAVDSTNNYAMGKVHAGLASHGTAVFALQQTAGKGQRGKSWISEPGRNILLSIVLEPVSADPAKQFPLSAAIALGCVDLLKSFEPHFLIKWPNDIYWRDRKAGGILIESICRGNECQYVVAGMGININQQEFPVAAGNPVSLAEISGQSHDPAILASGLCRALDLRYRQLEEYGSLVVLEEYNLHLYKRKGWTRLKLGKDIISTRVESVSGDGFLHTSDSMTRRFYSGEVEWLPD